MILRNILWVRLSVVEVLNEIRSSGKNVFREKRRWKGKILTTQGTISIEADSFVHCERLKDTEQRDLQNGTKTSLCQGSYCPGNRKLPFPRTKLVISPTPWLPGNEQMTLVRIVSNTAYPFSVN
ncbi:uncharacterized protein [Montipora foliosa]|uniref:uncharacterized protein n=1 Tax=Montipora foliosa TaxID=591990 RepID=UPI0035F1B02D